MLNSDDLRKQLTASEAYNRYMDKRVRMLEMEVQMLQSANRFQTHTVSPTKGGDSSAVGDDKSNLTAAQILEELMRLRVDFRNGQSLIKSLKKELSITTANLQHITAKEHQQRQRAAQLAEEVRQLKSLLPPHLFDGSSSVSGSVYDSVAPYRDPALATPSRRGHSGADIADEGTLEGHLAAARGVQDATQTAVKKLMGDVEEMLHATITLPSAAYDASTPPPSGWPVDLATLPTVKSRVDWWRHMSSRLHTVLKFSKKVLSDSQTDILGSTQRDGQKDTGTPRGSTKRTDRTQAQLEALLALVDRNADQLKALVLELPKSVGAYLTKCRSGVGVVVDGQRANTPTAIAGLTTQAAGLAGDMRRHREDFCHLLRALQSQVCALSCLVMSCVDGAVGVNSYRNIPHALKFVSTLEGQVAVLMSLDQALEADVLKSLSVGAAASASSGDSAAWYQTGLDIEVEVRRLSALDPRVDKVEKLDISAIKKLFPDGLSGAASMAASGLMSPAVAECIVLLETLKSSASQLSKLFRGEISGAFAADASRNATGDDAGGLSSKGIQCNLQQQKMQMTEYELHIARLASIRSNWFDSAVSQHEASSPNGAASPSASGGSPSPRHDASQDLTTPRGGNRTPRLPKATLGDIERLLSEYRSRFPQLAIPSNFGAVQTKSQRFKSESDGFAYRFGRRVISLNVTGNGMQLAVHVGGGYITFEEFCFKYGPGEVLMLERRAASRGGDALGGHIPASSDITVDSKDMIGSAAPENRTVPKLKASFAASLSRTMS